MWEETHRSALACEKGPRPARKRLAHRSPGPLTHSSLVELGPEHLMRLQHHVERFPPRVVCESEVRQLHTCATTGVACTGDGCELLPGSACLRRDKGLRLNIVCSTVLTTHRPEQRGRDAALQEDTPKSV